MKSTASYIDNTLLKPTTSWEELETFCESSRTFDFASVCIPPFFVSRAAEILGDSNIGTCTVIGFPLGYHSTKAKIIEVKEAMKNGAEELDIVVNSSWVKSEKWDEIRKEMIILNDLIHAYYGLSKWIVETAYLNEKELIKLTELCMVTRADYIKTSTGFASTGADLSDVRKIKEWIGDDHLKIKASGGISSKKEMMAFIDAGAERIGTSRGLFFAK